MGISGAYLNANAAGKMLRYLEKNSDLRWRGVWLVVISRELYGLQSLGKVSRDHMAATLQDFGCVSCKADPDMRMKPKTDAGGFKCCSYVLV